MQDMSEQVIPGYELLEQIGDGGFGVVYRAYQPLLKREVAIKIILPEYANDPEFIRRFEIEAETVARLEHPHIVPLYDYWRDATGAYLVMRYFQDGDLGNSIKKGAMDPEHVVLLIDHVAKALHLAHRHHVIHRDIKPQNILVDGDMNAYLSDFGIAKTPDFASATSNKDIAGTLLYAAPEQLQGFSVTPQADMYALGVTIYEMLAGEHPFSEFPVMAILHKQLNDPLPDISEYMELPQAVDDVIQKATAKDPTQRYDTVTELAHALSKALNPTVDGQRHTSSQMEHAPQVNDTIPVVNPYRGLYAFEEIDAEYFFGRDSTVNRLVNRLDEDIDDANFLAVVGSSGSGKSSLVKAGLIPKLRQDGLPDSSKWYFVETYPGNQPFAELEAALHSIATDPMPDMYQILQEPDGLMRLLKRLLPDNQTTLLLLIDQFEELFTLTTDEKQRSRYIENLMSALHDARGHLKVILTLRADFFDKPLQYYTFGHMLRHRMETVLPLSKEELHDAIVQPASTVGINFQAGLVDVIIQDVQNQPGMLPLLQYALTEVFQIRQGYTITLEDYQQIGGVTGALTQRADELFNQLNDSKQKAVRQVLLHLVTMSEDGTATRRRVRQDELTVDEILAEVVTLFGEHRLLTFDRDPETRVPTVEIAHESLLQNWKQLRQWLSDAEGDLRVYQRLTGDAREWNANQRQTDFLAADARLVQYEIFAQDSEFTLSDTEKDFIDRGLSRRETQRTAEAERIAYEMRLQQQSATRLRYLASALVIFLVVAVILSFWALSGQRAATDNAATSDANVATAEQAQEQAIESANVADAQRLSAQSLLNLRDGAFDISMLLSLESLNLVETTQGQTNLLETLLQSPYLDRRIAIGVPDPSSTIVDQMTISPQGLIAYVQETSLILRDADTLNILLTVEDWSRIPVSDLAFSPEGETLAMVDENARIRFWDVALQSFSDDEIMLSQVSPTLTYSPNGNLLAVADGSNIMVFSLMNDENTPTILESHEGAVLALKFSPDGQWLASASTDETVRLWVVNDDMIDSEPVRVLRGHQNWVLDVAFDVTSSEVASASADTTIQRWDVNTGQPLDRPLQGHNGWVRSVDYVGDSNLLISSGDDRLVIRWDSNREYHPLLGHRDAVVAQVVSPNSEWVITSGQDGRMLRWGINASPQFIREGRHSDSVVDVFMMSRNDVLVSVGQDGRIWLDDTQSQESESFTAAAPITNTHLIVLADAGGRVITYDVISRTIITEAQYEGGFIQDVAVDGTGQLLALAASDGMVLIWDLPDLNPVYAIRAHNNNAVSIAFHPQQALVISGGRDSHLRLIDVTSGTIVTEVDNVHLGGIQALTFNPDGDYFASGGRDNRILLWQLDVSDFSLHLLGSVSTNSRIWSLAYSPDGNFLASGGMFGDALLWDVSEQDIRQLHSNPFNIVISTILSMSFNPTGNQLVLGYENGIIVKWNIGLSEWRMQACSIVNRNLSENEWERFLPNQPYHETCSDGG